MPEKTNLKFNSLNGKRKVLIIEDDPVNLDILKTMLDETYEVVSAANGSEALEVIRSQHETLSIILLDLNLPDINGLDVLRSIKSHPVYSEIPVIVMTADGDAEVECLTLGAVDFIPKPYPRQKVVLARILRTIELYENRDILRWAERDHLTGLYNKEFFYRYAVLLDTYHREQAADAIVIDVNHFHTINDRYGKAYGDSILKHIAERTLETVEETGGIACRSGADTFLIYLPHTDDYQGILETISAFLDGEGNIDNHVRVRMGVYSNVDKSLDIERRFDRAKMAADQIKDNYTKAIGIYDNSMYEAEVLSEQLIEDFPAAIREKQFKVYYQPKFDLRPSEPLLSSAEALVRWDHPKMGLVSPGVFIPIFEKNGLVQILDHYVWSETAAQMREWKERFNVTFPVSMNVSRVDLYDPQIVENLRAIADNNGLNYADLLLEITESAYTDDFEQIVEKVKELRGLGFRIEMDDFGSGYSSLNMLSTLPIDALKLDMQFIRNAFKESRDTRLLEAMIQLAAAFEVPTIAEGVETAEQVLTLKMMGCDIIQGYYFSRPLPAEEFEAFISENIDHSETADGKKTMGKHEKFTYNALHDSLTGLYNNSAFEILYHDIDHDRIAVIVADISGYEEIKRDKGGAYADRVVRRVTNALRGNFRSVDYICRTREDAFVIIMTRITSAEKDLALLKIERAAQMLKTSDGEIGPVELCAGVAFSERENPDGDVFADADAALKRLKESGRTGYGVY